MAAGYLTMNTLEDEDAFQAELEGETVAEVLAKAGQRVARFVADNPPGTFTSATVILTGFPKQA